MLYFAYGSNMNPDQMADRTPGARSLGRARLPGWRLTFTGDIPAGGGGVPHIEIAPGDEVWGVLWDLTEDNLNTLDDYEGVALGAYVRDLVSVEHKDALVEAVVYVAVPRGYEKPSKVFLAAVVRGAEAHGLPDWYLDRLRAFADADDHPGSR